MQENNEGSQKIPGLVRAWGDEPVRLFAYRIDTTRTYVGSEASIAPIGIPHWQVFQYNEEKFTELSTAFQQGDANKVGRLWSEMGVDDYACNKYKIKLELPHDKENISGSCGVASSGEQ